MLNQGLYFGMEELKSPLLIILRFRLGIEDSDPLFGDSMIVRDLDFGLVLLISILDNLSLSFLVSDECGYVAGLRPGKIRL